MTGCSSGLYSVLAFEQYRVYLHVLVSGKTFFFREWKATDCTEAHIPLPTAGTRKTTTTTLTVSNLASHHLFTMPVRRV